MLHGLAKIYKFKSELKKKQKELPHDPTPAHVSNKTIIQKDMCTTLFIAALFITAKTWKQTKCPLKKLIYKHDVVHI